MFTIIGGDGKEYGPVSVEQVRRWIAAGRANFETRARRVGEESWHPLRDFVEFSTDGSAMPPPLAPDPFPPGVPVEARAYAENLIARAGRLDVFGCIERSWQLLRSHFWALVGVTFLVEAVAWGVGRLAGTAPPRYYVGGQQVFGSGTLVSVALGAVFYAGLYRYYLKKIRGVPTDVGDAFAGFTTAFFPLVVLSLVSTLFEAAGFMLLVLPGIYLSVAYIFAQILVIDQKLGFWTAMEVSRRVITAQWWRMFGLLLLGMLVALLGLFGFVVGILITLPILFGAIAYAYEDLCRPGGVPSAAAVPAEPAGEG